jgi:hypothetical protein
VLFEELNEQQSINERHREYVALLVACLLRFDNIVSETGFVVIFIALTEQQLDIEFVERFDVSLSLVPQLLRCSLFEQLYQCVGREHVDKRLDRCIDVVLGC